jgi:hypothetical protein
VQSEQTHTLKWISGYTYFAAFVVNLYQLFQCVARKGFNVPEQSLAVAWTWY